MRLQIKKGNFHLRLSAFFGFSQTPARCEGHAFTYKAVARCLAVPADVRSLLDFNEQTAEPLAGSGANRAPFKPPSVTGAPFILSEAVAPSRILTISGPSRPPVRGWESVPL